MLNIDWTPLHTPMFEILKNTLRAWYAKRYDQLHFYEARKAMPPEF